ncbi:glycerophosphodiester phosphodiesterase [Hymenobacter yonginensis]|uniref:Glycerophosphodiester phosphodiesterase family protein n=1 Tax=Hymenobacter yonginensis TaxID=748197 RepID=A0ABY7PP21_9BACT|nr:glycerophosphodiester phosphodiesterase family protein [Hymenobacter yonginensis]WBO85008.1 glycerophosphodiester phosphodiesterase family protein [Hymenobacter yonginensis]
MSLFSAGWFRPLLKRVGLGLALLLPAACTTAPTLPANYRPLVIGHAGSAFLTPINPFNPLPPNSGASLQQALDRGADGLEVDLQLSQDSVLMLYHDSRLESLTTGQGCVSEQPAAALQQLQYRAGWPYDWFQEEKLLTLEDLLRRTQGQHPHLHFDLHQSEDCRPDAYGRAAVWARALARLLKRYPWPPERLLILTTHQPTLALLRRELPGVPLGLEVTEDFATGLQSAKAEQVQAIVLSKDLVSLENTQQAHDAGLQVVTFGGRSASTVKRLLSTLPDAIETDNVPAMRDMVPRQ